MTVERQTDKPKATPRASAKKTDKGAIQPAMVEGWFVQAFAMTAMMKGQEHWLITRPDIEVRPWSASAAELVNKLSGEHAQKIAEANAAVAVTLGVFTLVSARMRIDQHIRMEKAKQKRATMRTQEGLPPDGFDPDIPAESNGRRSEPLPGTGAQSLHPEETIFGNVEGIS